MTATNADNIPTMVAGAQRRNMGLVVAASAAGTTFEWYDFFLFVPLAAIISKVFFAGLNDAAAYIFALLSFAAGFATRPVGALIFGRIGDRVGRKGTFLITISLMGVATFAVGFLPTYAQAGVVSPVLFIVLRMLQGIALGGEWGGAAIYIGEHSAPERRGYMTSWIGTSAAFGLGAALIVVLVTRTALGESAFAAWGWRLPFMLSAILLGVSIWIRMTLHESPVFAGLRDRGERSTAPYRESFGTWKNLKLVLIALFSMMVAQGAIWYCAFFYAQSFIEKIVKVRPETVNAVMIAVVACSAPMYVFFGWLSDKIGRKIVMVSGGALSGFSPDRAGGQSGAGRRVSFSSRDGDRRSRHLLPAVRPGGKGAVQDQLRHRQERAHQRRRLLHQPSRPGRNARQREDRRRDRAFGGRLGRRSQDFEDAEGGDRRPHQGRAACRRLPGQG
jgi:MFS family permease